MDKDYTDTPPMPPKEKCRFTLVWDEESQQLSLQGKLTTQDEVAFFSELLGRFSERMSSPTQPDSGQE